MPTRAGFRLLPILFALCVPLPLVAGPSVSADLSITKTSNTPVAQVGDQVTFTITVTNNGPDAASSVTMTDSLPAGLSYVSATPSQGSCDTSVVCSLGTLANNASATVTIVATVTSLPTKNVAMVDAATGDPVASNGNASVTITQPAVQVPAGGPIALACLLAGLAAAGVLALRD